MPAGARLTIPTRLQNFVIQVTDDGSRTLIRTDTDDAYHSASGAISETRHVYLNNSGVLQRLERRRRASVLEIGLGTGMGLLMTVDAAKRDDAELRYVSIENEWLPADILRQLEPTTWIDDHELVESFLRFRESLPSHVGSGTYPWKIAPRVHVTIQACDVCSHDFNNYRQFDAVYFDPFAPSSNSQLWQPALLSRLMPVLADDGRLVTYCVSRQVRETMIDVGFDVQRVPGPQGGKREVLIATRHNRSSLP